MKEEILKLKQGEKYIVPEFDYGRAEVWLLNDVYILFEIPYLGGQPFYNNTYPLSAIDKMIHEIETWN